MADAARPCVHSIAPGRPFLDALAAGILSRHGTDPVALSRVTVLLPTRRACRALGNAFLRQSEGVALLLPRIRPLGDADEDELDLHGVPGEPALPLPPLARTLLLARLVAASPLSAGDPANACRLAEALGDLLDSAITEDVDLARLDDLVAQGDPADHWKLTLKFLTVIRETWPAIKAERQAVDASEAQQALAARWLTQWREAPPADPVIAAGSTGTIPSTARLLHLIARLPQGCVVLPGLDQQADDVTWQEIASEPTHPQHTLARLLDALGIQRGDVTDWPASPAAASIAQARAALLSEAMLPPGQTHRWRERAPLPDTAFAGLKRIVAPGMREEALAIAMALRETLEMPGRTAALVTPDRDLARRVAAELARYGIAVDDSAGRPLDRTPPATFIRLVAAAASGTALTPLLALLKHPFCRLGRPRGEWLSWVRAVEKRLRADDIARANTDAAAAAVAGYPRLADGLAALTAALAPLAAALRAELTTIPALLRAHVAVAETLAATGGEDAAPLWRQEAGEALHAFVVDLLEQGAAYGQMAGADWPRLLEALLQGRVVRPRHGSHPRLFIWGLLEARLQSADRIVLGGLNEGVWPPQPPEDPWLNRAMRTTLGLPSPERRIGQTAQDFVQAMAHADVVLSRAEKVDGTPTVPARWLARLQALLHDDPRWAATLSPEYRVWGEGLDAPEAYRPSEAPKPTPPLHMRPRQLAVTGVETWIRDPYAIFARYILKLRPLDEPDQPPDARLRGNVVHRAVEAFLRNHAGRLGDGDAALAILLEEGKAAFGPWLADPTVRVLWWPRFIRAMRWFLQHEQERRAAGIIPALLEQKGAMTIPARGGDFTLTAKADRLDRFADGRLAVLDYKTGAPPSVKQVETGLAPQLPLEAAIAKAGGFAGLAAAAISQLGYIRLGGGETPGELSIVASENEADALADAALAKLAAWIDRFDDPATPYLSRPRPQFAKYAGDYDHLARAGTLSEDGE